MAKIILTHEVTGLGAPGDVVEVKDGYARNYLIPRNLAAPWTKGAEKDITAIRKARKAREIASLDDAKAIRDSLQSKPVVVSAKAGDAGRLFGAVTTAEIAEAVKASGAPAIDKRKVEIAQPIKALGEYTVSVRLHPEVAATVTVKVVTIVLIVLMSLSTFTTQHQLMRKNMPSSALDNPFARQQKVLLYVMPLFFAISGVNFPIGVLLYWLTTNVWSMCQQFYVIRRMPAPGSPAEQALRERKAKRGKVHEEFTVKGLKQDEDAEEAPKTGGQRVQPTRNKKRKNSQAKPKPSSAVAETKPQTDN